MAAATFSCPTVNRHCLVIGLVGVLLAGPALATTAAGPLVAEQQASAQRLQQRLAAADGVVAGFTQVLIDSYGRMLETSEGRFWLAKPRLKWETLAPFPQTITVDAARIRIFDPDLEQVTERAVADEANQAPLLLLTQGDVADAFLVSSLDAEAGADEVAEAFRLRPRSDEVLFEHIDVTFSERAIREIRIVDHAGQQTVIAFRDMTLGVTIEQGTLELDVPAGTDIVQG